MTKKKYNKLHVITHLKMSIEFGADEAVLNIPRDRFNEKSSNFVKLSDTSKKSQVDLKILSQSAPKEKNCGPNEIYLQAIESARACSTVLEISNAVRAFTHFKKNNESTFAKY